MMGIASAFALRATARQIAPPILRDSYDEESVRGVAAELLDEAVFPVEVGLHRAFLDIGALIGTAVTVRRVGLWDHKRRADLERTTVIAAFEHASFPSHLREPGRSHIGADMQIIRQHDARAAHR